jgi:hypothetical protein
MRSDGRWEIARIVPNFRVSEFDLDSTSLGIQMRVRVVYVILDVLLSATHGSVRSERRHGDPEKCGLGSTQVPENPTSILVTAKPGQSQILTDLQWFAREIER